MDLDKFVQTAIVNGFERKVIERFLKKVQFSASGCWNWTGAISSGRALFSIDGYPVKASRIAYAMAFSPIPPELLACHSCDNGKCVNPEHIFPGTHKENSQDMVQKGRFNTSGRTAAIVAPKKKNYGVGPKLSPEDVAEIRQRLANKERATRIAARFNIHPYTVARIGKGELHRPVPAAEPMKNVA